MTVKTFQTRLLGYLIAAVLAWSTGGFSLADSLETGEVGLHANTVSEAYDALTVGAEQVALALLMILIVGVVVLGIWSSATQRGSGGGLVKLAAGPSADNLFLAAKFSVPGGDRQEHVGYLRSLRLRSASLVSPVRAQKGDVIKLSMSSLPGFPARDLAVEGIVTAITSMGDDPENFLLHLRFKHLADSERWPISSYIIELSKPRGAFSQA